MGFNTIVSVASGITCIVTCIALMIRPVREWILGTKDIKDGQKCLLRSEIVKTYYKHADDKELREFEWANMDECYKAYRRLGGNSFIVKLHKEMSEWTIVR